jgi:hypothetical protein
MLFPILDATLAAGFIGGLVRALPCAFATRHMPARTYFQFKGRPTNFGAQTFLWPLAELAETRASISS